MLLKAERLAWPHKVKFAVFSLLQVPPDMADRHSSSGKLPSPSLHLLSSGARILLLSSGIFLPGSPQCVFELQSHLINRKAGHPDSSPAAWDQL